VKNTVQDYRATVRQIQYIGRRYAVIEAFTSENFSYAPQQDGRFELCVILDDERIRKVLSSWSEGSTFICSAPGGRFPVPSHERSVVCIAGGSGITPLRAIIEDRVNKGSTASTILLYGCQSDDEIPFYHSLESLSRINQGLSLKFYADEVPLGRALPGRPLNFISNHLIKDADYLLCGPPGFMEAARRILEESGVPKDAIHQDRF
jgi:ferredoxin-NADP reductase